MNQAQDPIRFSATKMKFTVDDREYQWFGGFGSIIESHERGIKVGDTRAISGIIFYAFSIRGGSLFTSPTVGWGVPDDVDMDWIRKLKRAIFK